MTPSRVDMLVVRLREMQAATPEIESSAVVSADGLFFWESRRVAQDLEQVVG